MTQFSDLGLAEPLLKALASKGYTTPTPIQTQAIPALLEGRDLCGIAQTGTGKTAAFALPALDRLAREGGLPPKRSARILVLSPTRELAAQIADSFRDYGRFMRVSVTTVFGGVPITKQIRAMVPGVDVLVATPGRLMDLMEQKAIHLKGVETFVLDEADQMMDMGFLPAVKKIVAELPQKRQSLFFSATMPPEIAKLANAFLDDPVQVSVAPQSTTAEKVRQFVTFVDQKEKSALLQLAIKAQPIDRALVFVKMKHACDRVVRQLESCGISSVSIHGDKSQAQRTAALQAFRHGHVPILVATDIAARGIDVSGVSHVFNYDIPHVAEHYVHRIGRTARAGAEGVAISFCSDDERSDFKAIERITGVKCEVVPLPDNFNATVAAMPKPAAVKREAPRGNRGPGQGKSAKGKPDYANAKARRSGGPGRGGPGRGGPNDGGPRGGGGGEGRPSGGGRRTGNVGSHRGAIKPSGRQGGR